MRTADSTPLEPANIGAETKVIGSLFIDRDLITPTMDRVRPYHFWSTHNAWVYDSICSLWIDGKPVTPDTVAVHLASKSESGRTRLELVGGANTIIGYMEGVDPSENEYWVDEVLDKYERRKLINMLNDSIKTAYKSETPISVIRNKVEANIVSLGKENTSTSVAIGVATDLVMPRIERYINDPDGIIGMESTFTSLDRALDGFQPGNVSIIYAPSSRFKSLFSQNICWRFAQQGHPGLWFTTEMPTVQVAERIMQLQSGLNLKMLRSRGTLDRFKGDLQIAQRALRELPIYFCDKSSLDVNEVVAEVSRHKRWHGIEYVLIDLVDHISSSRFKDEMVNNQRVVMSAMKQLAKDFNIHVLLVSHVHKGSSEQRSQADLDVENMTGSAAKYQDVDASVSIGPVTQTQSGQLRAMSREEIIQSMAENGRLPVLISVTKNRHGELVRYRVTLDFNLGGRFVEHSDHAVINWTPSQHQGAQMNMEMEE